MKYITLIFLNNNFIIIIIKIFVYKLILIMEKKVIPYARTDFGPPPPGYIAGLGRGAVGFITRADIGPSS